MAADALRFEDIPTRPHADCAEVRRLVAVEYAAHEAKTQRDARAQVAAAFRDRATAIRGGAVDPLVGLLSARCNTVGGRVAADVHHVAAVALELAAATLTEEGQ